MSIGIVSWLLVGLLVGYIASTKMKARGIGILVYLAVSVLGAVVGGLNVAYLYRLPGAMDGFNLIAILVAIIGALVANALLRLLTPAKSPVV